MLNSSCISHNLLLGNKKSRQNSEIESKRDKQNLSGIYQKCNRFIDIYYVADCIFTVFLGPFALCDCDSDDWTLVCREDTFREDGTIVEFSGANLIYVGTLSYGDVPRYYQLERQQCCFPRTIGGHTCNKSSQHSEFGTGVSWDDAVHLSARNFEHRSSTFSLATATHFLNRLSYGGSMDWNMVNVWALILSKGSWVDGSAILRSFVPFIVMLCYGVLMLGWPFVVIMLSFFLLIAGWYLLITYCFKNLVDDED